MRLQLANLCGESLDDCATRLCQDLKDSLVDITAECDATPDCNIGILNPKPGTCTKDKVYDAEDLPWPEHTSNGCGLSNNGSLFFGKACSKSCKATTTVPPPTDCEVDGSIQCLEISF